jgi:hypothetical protein
MITRKFNKQIARKNGQSCEGEIQHTSLNAILPAMPMSTKCLLLLLSFAVHVTINESDSEVHVQTLSTCTLSKVGELCVGLAHLPCGFVQHAPALEMFVLILHARHFRREFERAQDPALFNPQ